jgi:hypothetical protein
MQPVDNNANLAVVFCFENEQVQKFFNNIPNFLSNFNYLSTKEIEGLSKKNIEKYHESMVSLNAPRIFLKYKCNLKKNFEYVN